MSAEVVVAGHACLDLIPSLPRGIQLEPGRLSEVGPMTFAPGGAVPNVGIALETLGTPARLVGCVGDDAFGEVLLSLLRERFTGGDLVFERMQGQATSYTVIVSPPDVDRLFLHHSGSNDQFSPDRIGSEAFAHSRVLYFGYPPAMQASYEDGGDALADLFQRAKAANVTTALDMSLPDPDSRAGRQDWSEFLKRVLPHVDVFLPSWEEIHFMVEGKAFAAHPDPNPEQLATIARSLLDLGCAVVGIKLGSKGMYLLTGEPNRMAALGRAAPTEPNRWADRELWAPVFTVDVVGTTGSGDSTVAGFLAALLRDLSPEETLRMAVAVGGHCVEAPDATSGLRSWAETESRVRGGWPQQPHPIPDNTWRRCESTGVLIGAGDQNPSFATRYEA